MFYYFLAPLAPVFGPFNLFNYISFRCFGALITSLALCFIFAPAFIRALKRAHVKQPIRDDGPKQHRRKEGTPTMGGALILLPMMVSTLLWADLSNVYLWITLGVVTLFALIGGIDDYKKLRTKTHRGLSARTRLVLEAMACGVGLIFLYDFVDGALLLQVPFFKDVLFDLGVFAVPFAMLVIMGSANGVNLTDGLDGLAVVPVMFVLLCFLVISWVVGHSVAASYLQLSYVPSSGELAIFCAAALGACLGFLWYNAPPAMIFMGDMGALAIGSALGCIAVITRHELVLVIVGGLFVVETVSVIIQVLAYRLTGKRVFLMAPLHHHFEQRGWQEATIVVRFWIISAVLALMGLATLKIR